MNGFGKQVYGHPFRNNTEWSGPMRPYRYWAIRLLPRLPMDQYTDNSGDTYIKRIQYTSYIQLAKPLDANGNDMTDLAIRKSPRIEEKGEADTWYSSGDNSGFNDVLVFWEFEYPQLVYQFELELDNCVVSWCYQYSWDGMTWATIKIDNVNDVFVELGASSIDYNFTRNLWT